MKIIKIPITKINPAPYNPRIELSPGDVEYEKLKQSIQKFGYVDPLIWNERTGHLVGGHQRFKILVDEGFKEIDVSVVDMELTQEKALNIALNKISGDWDLELLNDLLQELDVSEIDVTLTGFDLGEIDELISQVSISSFEESVNEPFEDNFDVYSVLEENVRLTEYGDIWRLGEHLLLVGDSTKEKDILKVMNQDEADMIFTDPPYNVAYEGATKDKLKIANDNMGDEEFYLFLYNAFSAAFKVTKKGGAVYICHSDSEGLNFRKAMIESGFLLKQCLIWNKNTFVLGRQDYQWKHEPILYGWKPGASHNWYGDRKQTTVIEDNADITLVNHGDYSILSFFNGAKQVVIKVKEAELITDNAEEFSTIWRIDKPKRNGDHPTMKPITLCARAILCSSKVGDIVLDMFGGGGSTLIACEQTGRKCRIVEYDPKYADVIIRRWEDFSGEKAIKLS
ncbi:lactate dehydrogenase [[Bacillus] sp. KCTC 13219]|nr:lactate dehydrogenase [[Bacillus] sp. KCTC 13219]